MLWDSKVISRLQWMQWAIGICLTALLMQLYCSEACYLFLVNIVSIENERVAVLHFPVTFWDLWQWVNNATYSGSLSLLSVYCTMASCVLIYAVGKLCSLNMVSHWWYYCPVFEVGWLVFPTVETGHYAVLSLVACTSRINRLLWDLVQGIRVHWPLCKNGGECGGSEERLWFTALS